MPEQDYSEQIREFATRIASGGVFSMSGLFDLTAHRLIRFALTITRNQHDAEDSVQAALMTVVARPIPLATVERPWHYLLKMVRNESLILLRKKRRWIFGLGLGDLLANQPCDSVEQEDIHRAVWLALRTLPIEQRQVVVLKIWEEMTFQEIADVLDCTLPTAASRYRYAIQKLTPKLQAYAKESSHV